MEFDFEALEAALSARLSERAFEHCVGTAETSVELAHIYGVDADEARAAGLLHDWDRETPKDQLIAHASAHGRLRDTELRQPKLLHARTGAMKLRKEFPNLPDEVYVAIERHTVGAVEMGDLDMVVYLADMIEPGRDWPGVDDLRRCVGEVSLGQLFFLGYQASLETLVRRRKRLHPDTVDVWNSLVSREKTAKRAAADDQRAARAGEGR